MLIMTLYVLSRLSIPIENLIFSLPVCMFFVNIPVYRLGFMSVADISSHLQDAGPGLQPSSGTQKWGADNYKVTIAS